MLKVKQEACLLISISSLPALISSSFWQCFMNNFIYVFVLFLWPPQSSVRIPSHMLKLITDYPQVCVREFTFYPAPNTPVFNHKWSMQSTTWMLIQPLHAIVLYIESWDQEGKERKAQLLRNWHWNSLLVGEAEERKPIWWPQQRDHQ